MLRGYVFDVDGTLVLSNDAHAMAWQEALAKHGYMVELNDIRRLVGMGGDKLLENLHIGLTDTKGDGKEIKAARLQIFMEKYAPTLQAAPGARKLIAAIQEQGLAVIVATAATKEELDMLLEKAGVADLIPHAATADDARNSKPDPDIIEAALEKVGLMPDEVLMVGDTPYDIEAACKAGVRTIAVRCGGWDDDDLDGASVIYDDPDDIVAHMDGHTRE